jgi:hypothetical protein
VTKSRQALPLDRFCAGILIESNSVRTLCVLGCVDRFPPDLSPNCCLASQLPVAGRTKQTKIATARFAKGREPSLLTRQPRRSMPARPVTAFLLKCEGQRSHRVGSLRRAVLGGSETD